MFKNKRLTTGFTLVEILVVIAIISLLISLAIIAMQDVRQKGRDTQRVSDIKSIQVALEKYYRDENQYPATLDFGQPLFGSTSPTTYMTMVPMAPMIMDGQCDATSSNYIYLTSNDNQKYSLQFCLGGKTGEINRGINCAHPTGVTTGACPE